MTAPVVARPKPCLVTLKGGRTYFWCTCGRSAKQPFCDGSHKGTDLEPLKFVADADEEVLLCGCKQTATAPFCDGAHTNLPEGSPLDDPESPENRAIPLVTERDGARALLNGTCYVVSPALAAMTTRGSLTLLLPRHRGTGLAVPDTDSPGGCRRDLAGHRVRRSRRHPVRRLRQRYCARFRAASSRSGNRRRLRPSLGGDAADGGAGRRRCRCSCWHAPLGDLAVARADAAATSTPRYRAAGRVGRCRAAHRDGPALLPDPRRQAHRLEGHHAVHRSHPALQGGAPSPPVRGGDHRALGRGLHVDRGSQRHMSGQGT